MSASNQHQREGSTLTTHPVPLEDKLSADFSTRN